MSAKLDRIIKGLKEAIREANRRKTSSLDTPATVTRIDGDTMYVHMDGGTPETPIKRTINAKVGDTVQIRAKGGQAWATGNQTAPPTDDTTAVKAEVKAEKADVLAQLAKKTADKAGKTATNYLSWSAEYGLIVSEDATENPNEMTGGSTRVTFDGVEMYKGQTRVAKFGEESIIGDEDSAHAYLDPDTFNVTSDDGVKFFSVDMDGETRGVTIRTNGSNQKDVSDYIGYPSIWTSSLNFSPIELESGDGFTVNFVMEFASEMGGTTVFSVINFVKGTAKSDTFSIAGETYNVDYDGDKSFVFEGYIPSSYFPSADYATWEYFAYVTRQVTTPSYSSGTRISNTKGAFSSTFGEGLTAEKPHQSAFGKYNEGNPDSIFEIGYGTASTPKNIFAVDVDGNVIAENVPAMMECGEITTSNVASHDYADYQVTFSKTFSSAPKVVVGMMSSSTLYGVGSVSVSAHSITANGFTARIFNNDSSARSPYIHWIAMLQ